MDPLHTFFHPRGVAVVGASSKPNKLSYGVLHNLATHGYDGPIYPVNPKGGEILGLKAYPTVTDVPDPVELAVIILPPELSIETVAACGERGIKAVVVVASGFGELGAGGEAREAQLRQVVERHGMRLIGPNCIGVLDTSSRVDTTFLTAMPERGGVGFASHSGAICGGTVDWANTVGFGFSRIISLGNQADVSMADALASLAADAQTRVAVAYIEGLPQGRQFVEVASALTRQKPLVVVKAGSTPSGTRAVASHTGALAGENRAFEAACHRVGALQVEDLQELIDASLALNYRGLLRGTRIALLTNAGGPAAVGADALDRQGLHLVELSADTQGRLKEICPAGTMTGNPVDMLGGAEPGHFAAALEVLVDAPEVDGVLVAFVPQALTGPPEVAAAVGGAALALGRRADAAAEKPVVCCIYGGRAIDEAARTLHAHSVPHYLTPARAAFGLGTLWRYRQIATRASGEPEPVAVADRERAVDLLAAAQVGERRVLDAQAGAELAAAYGLSVPPSGLAGRAQEAVALADGMGYPVALKRVAPGVVHKSDVGGVTLDLRDADGVHDAFKGMVREGERGFVQQMAPGGLEVIVGAQRDRQFGPVVMFGLGGVYVEVLEDVAFRLAPLSEADAREMVMETAAGRLLAGVRGQPGRDIEAVVETIRGVAQLMVDLPEVAEVDLNPLMVGEAGEGAWAVDVRVVVDRQASA
ncbi:MAG: acetate--CoA ligase family protein [Anaerolineae bacterium]|jgi:acetyltransferase